MPVPTHTAAVFSLLIAAGSCAWAADGKLLGSGGLVSIEGNGGGALTSWALIAGNGEEGQSSYGAGVSRASTQGFALTSVGAFWSWNNRLELSAAHQSLDLDALVEQGAADRAAVSQDMLGLKWRLAGDAIYARSGQWALGAVYKRNNDFDLVRATGAERDDGIDAYLAWTKLWLDGPWHRNLLLSVGLRATQAHQLGLSGFDNSHTMTGEAALGLFLTPNWVVGAEYRNKPDRLALAAEDDWADLYLAWIPNPRWRFTLGYLDLGSIGGVDDQHGWYASLQFHE